MANDDIPTIGEAMLERPRIDFERGMSFLPPVSILLCLACTGVFAWQLSTGALASEDAIIRAGALNGPRVAAGEYWRMITAVFLHGSPDHLIGNLVVLFILGMACEHAYGSLRYVPLYLLAGLGGSALSLVNGHTSVGASGAIFGLAGALVAFFTKYRREYLLRDLRVGSVLLVWAIYQVALGFMNPMIDNLAHIGGFVSGLLIGVVLRKRPREV
ncbi:MAG: rhomboid family intramembrane serine protease [Gemmataceae bacterium]|nr:rhomboid family intramembrane serine protease [Planctomycetia bacterium]MBX3398797.1 rhomboid family intramembrane serine protease [Gemmataceae bacterium]